MGDKTFQGLHTAVSTAISADLSPDVDRCRTHWRAVIDAGSHGICPFGTTGEGVAFSVTSRIALLDSVAGDISPDQMMPVVGSNSLADAETLVAHAYKLGCPGVLTLPPSYYKKPSDDGVFEFYTRLIDRVNDDRLRLFVYNIPQLTGVVIAHDVVERLNTRFGNVIAGIKDSWGKLDHTLAYIAAFPELAIFTGTDHHIVESMRAGGAGTVTGMGNVNPRALREVVDARDTQEAQALCHTVGEIHLIVEQFGGVPAMKSVIAHYRDDTQWEVMTPPLMPLSRERQTALIDALNAAGHVWPSAR